MIRTSIFAIFAIGMAAPAFADQIPDPEPWDLTAQAGATRGAYPPAAPYSADSSVLILDEDEFAGYASADLTLPWGFHVQAQTQQFGDADAATYNGFALAYQQEHFGLQWLAVASVFNTESGDTTYLSVRVGDLYGVTDSFDLGWNASVARYNGVLVEDTKRVNARAVYWLPFEMDGQQFIRLEALGGYQWEEIDLFPGFAPQPETVAWEASAMFFLSETFAVTTGAKGFHGMNDAADIFDTPTVFKIGVVRRF